MFLALLYNPTKTNLTYIGIHKNGSGTIGPTRELIRGSIHTCANYSKLMNFNMQYCNSMTGDIAIAFANCYKLDAILINHASFINGTSIGDTSDKIYGDIAVFADKYNAEFIASVRWSGIYGEAKSLKNLKKLSWFEFRSCNVTGSKTDLYNGGVNITEFDIGV